MRSVKKLLQRAMVFTLTAAMLVGTPLTASAAPLNSVFSISDGTGTWDGHEDGSGTGTVTNTDTNSGALIGENDAKIIGITLDAQTLNLEKGDKKPLKANVVLDGQIKDGENDITDDVIAEMSKKVKWEVLYVDAEGNKVTNQGDPAAKVGLELPEDWKDDRSTVQLNAKQGTEKGKEVTVRATIDAAYYYKKNESGDQNTEVLAWDDSRADIQYTAEAKVFVKEFSESLKFQGVSEEQYVKHTLDLSECLVRTPATANDTITWSTSDKNLATVTAAGVVTFKKVTKEDESVTIYAVGEKGAKASQDFTVSAGVPASKIEVWADVETEDGPVSQKVTKLTLDLRDNEPANVEVKMYAQVKGAVKSKEDSGKAAASEDDAKTKGNGYDTGKLEIENGGTYYTVGEDGALIPNTLEITDSVTWTTSKPTIATVAGDNAGAVITAAEKALGKARITAKASGGKKANVDVTVKATLTSLEIGNVPDELYSGQSVQLTALRDPVLNKDAVKWSVKKVEYEKNGETKTKTNPNASINKNGVLTIKPKLDSDYLDVTVVLETKATVKNDDGVKVPVCSAEETICIKQSSMDGFTITDDEGTPVAKFETTYKDNGKVKASKQTIKNKTTNISVPKGRTYTATVDSAPGQDYAGGAETLVWTSKSNKIAKVAANGDGTATITAVAAGTTTITVSGIRAENNEDGSIKSAKAIKVTFKVAVKQPATSLTIKTPSVVVKEAKNKNANVSFKITQNKGAKEKIDWSVVKNGEKNDAAATVTTKGKVTLKKNQYVAGDVFTVTAKAKESGVTAKATIKIITPSTGVRVVNENGDTFSYDQKKGKSGKKTVNNATTLDLGDSVTLYPQVKVATSSDPVWQDPDTTEDGKTTAGVTYSVNKKGIVQIVGNTVYRVNNGTVKVTVKTADGKKYTLTIDDESKKYVAPATE